MFKYLLLTVLLPAFAYGINFGTCGSSPAPTEVRVVGCTEVPCTLVPYENLEFDMDFVAADSTDTLTIDVVGRVGIITIPLDLGEELSEGCQFLTAGACPVTAGDELTLSVATPIESPVTNINLTIEFRLFKDDGSDLVCFSVPVHITA